ncbi:CobW family GTP-binding protein [Methylophaga thiooxydans]|uniref:CobW/P47K family protein n=1 Tax=Methylophaga thiooxydans DMS010 TaxID=637616 RepID=C0N905_9GAMM|nr:GTP-binding protein [Methylophaga thiooxydans]EEF78651.1 CobW/P47K family protein [Methylophaga thiooxydans DMS010]
MSKTQTFSIQNALPTTVITGFLGVGKTSAIQHLLSYKPASERWAVLINEFGKVGIDRQILSSTAGQQGNVEIREVAGGCMCCSAGLPMQVALNQLLRSKKLDRLLIEPSGLGHPEEVIASLAGPNYRGLLDIRSTLTMVDARHFKDRRYTEHPVFLQQLHIADMLVVNKTDLSQLSDIKQMEKTLMALHLGELPIKYCEQGKLDLDWLSAPAKFDRATWANPPKVVQLESAETPLTDSGFLRETQQLDGWHSCGWRFDNDWLFNSARLLEWCHTQNPDRLKAVINTSDGRLIINWVEGQLSYQNTQSSIDESRLEMLFQNKPDADEMERLLFQCRCHYSSV